jgi:hypothetical protein
LLQSIHDEAEPTIKEKGESKGESMGKMGWRVVKRKELEKIDN